MLTTQMLPPNFKNFLTHTKSFQIHRRDPSMTSMARRDLKEVLAVVVE